MEGFWFKSEKFKIEPGEDSETNPGRYGKSVATWLKGKLSALGYETKVVPEDWGWCVICSSKPFLLWVGCGNSEDFVDESSSGTVWHCFVEAEIPFFKKLFGKLDATSAKTKLHGELEQLLVSDSQIQLVGEP